MNPEELTKTFMMVFTKIFQGFNSYSAGIDYSRLNLTSVELTKTFMMISN